MFPKQFSRRSKVATLSLTALLSVGVATPSLAGSGTDEGSSVAEAAVAEGLPLPSARGATTSEVPTLDEESSALLDMATTTAPTSTSPTTVDQPLVGRVEEWVPAADSIRLVGFALDLDLDTEVSIEVTSGDRSLQTGNAALQRPEVAAFIGGSDGAHGFDLTQPLFPGEWEICATAVADTSGERLPLGCETVVIATPTTTTTTLPPTTTSVVPATLPPTTATVPPQPAPAPTPAPAAPTTLPVASTTTVGPASVAPTTVPATTVPATTTTAIAGDVITVPYALRAISACESGTRAIGTHSYTAHNRHSSASGAYQFLDSTWRYNATGTVYVNHWRAKGWEHLRLEAAAAPSADAARPPVQDAAAVVHFELNGTRPWNPSRSCWRHMI